MAGRCQADPSELPFYLGQRVGSAKTKGRSVATRPEAGTIGDDEQPTPLWCKDAIAFIQERIRLLAGFKAVEHNQLVDTVGFEWPESLPAKDRDILLSDGPVHDTLLSGHESSHAPGCLQIRTQERRGEPKADNRMTFRFGPESQNLIPDCALGGASERRAVIEAVQVDHVEMHLPICSQCPKLTTTIPRESSIAMPFEIVTVPCRSDNYAYLIHKDESTALVDAPEVTPIVAALEERGWALDEIWITHHHDDHISGVEELRNRDGAHVIGAKADAHRLPELDAQFQDDDSFEFAGSQVEVMDVSGHTVGHIAFYIRDAKAAFTADSLMALGCGRVFEGTMDQMWASLSKLATLPDDTLVYSGHEYTLANARFAVTIEPENVDLMSRIEEINRARGRGEPTVPAALSLEKATNPFLRAGLSSVKSYLNMAGESDADVFAEIRRRKDSF